MVVTVEITGLNEVKELLVNLPIKLNKAGEKSVSDFSEQTLKLMQLKAPIDTGFLRDQIKLEKKKSSEIIIHTGEAYYTYFQSFGYTPHIIPIEYIEQHRTLSPNIPGMPVKRPKAFVQVKRFTPFVSESLLQASQILPATLLKNFDMALKEATI